MPEESLDPTSASFRRNDRLASLTGHILVAFMLVCLSLILRDLGHALIPSWDGSYLPLITFIISVESMYTWRATHRRSNLDLGAGTYTLVEWVIIVLLIKLFLYAWYGFDKLWGDLIAMEGNFIDVFLTPETVFLILFSLLIWVLSGMLASSLIMLEGNEILVKEADANMFVYDRGAARRQISNTFFTVGFIMMIITAFINADARMRQGVDPASISRSELFIVLIYFLLGLALLSQTRLAVLRANWIIDRIPVSTNLVQRWVIFSILFMAVVILIAFLLPTSYTLGLLATLNYLVGILAMILGFIFELIIFPLAAIFGFIMSLFATGGVPEETQAQPPQIEVPPPAPVTSLPWLDILKSVLFWAVFLGVIGYAVVQYFRQNRELMDKLRRLPLFTWLAELLGRFRGALAGWNKQIGQAVRAGWRQLRRAGRSSSAPAGMGFLSLRRLSPRQRVLFFYLALVRRGGEAGLPRKPGQTPLEYVQTIKPRVQEADEDVEAMTEAFIEARYSRHEIYPEKASRVREYWDRIRKALRNTSK